MTTLDQALAIAMERNPGVRQAAERIARNRAAVQQILALKRPTISASASYSRIFNAQSSFGAAGGGSAVGVQNPFPATLSGAPPGSQTVQLSQSAPIISASAATRTRQTNTNTNTNIFAGTDLNQYATRLTISQLIDISGIVKAAQRIGDLQLEIDALDLLKRVKIWIFRYEADSMRFAVRNRSSPSPMPQSNKVKSSCASARRRKPRASSQSSTFFGRERSSPTTSRA